MTATGTKNIDASSELRSVRLGAVVATYPYTDENGALLYEVLRYKPKGFSQRRPDGGKKLDGVRRVLYRLPEVRKAIDECRSIYICEGEKDCDALNERFLTATCNAMGAGKWLDDYSQSLNGADVIICPDTDKAGEAHLQIVAEALTGIASSIKVLRLPKRKPDDKDAFDWFAAGGTVDEFIDLAEKAPAWELPSAAPAVALVSVCAASVRPEPIEWIWEGRIARGKHTAIAGEPGLGKSQTGIDIAARITREARWPHGEGIAPKGRVVILSAEDAAQDTIVPRLMAAGADLSMVEIIQAVSREDGVRKFSLETDIQLLEERINQLGDVLMILIDPISAYLGGKLDSHKDVAVRSAMSPVTLLAERARVAILSISHFNKSNGSGATKALHKFMGSIAFVAGPRVAFAIIEDPECPERRFMLHAKANIAVPAPGLAFSIKSETLLDFGITTSRVEWESGTVMQTADQVLAASSGRKRETPALDEAKELLTDLISTDGTAVREIRDEAAKAGVAWKTVRDAKDALKLVSEKSGIDGGWMWRWPFKP